MTKWTHYILDATMPSDDGIFCFCPIEFKPDGSFDIITGMNFVGRPPEDGKLYAIVHADGQQAVDEFVEKHKEALKELMEKY